MRIHRTDYSRGGLWRSTGCLSVQLRPNQHMHVRKLPEAGVKFVKGVEETVPSVHSWKGIVPVAARCDFQGIRWNIQKDFASVVWPT